MDKFKELVEQAVKYVEDFYKRLPSADKKKMALMLVKYGIGFIKLEKTDQEISDFIEDLVSIYNSGEDVIQFFHYKK